LKGGGKMKKVCSVCGDVYTPRKFFVQIMKGWYMCEKCFRRKFGPIQEYDEEIDEVWNEVNRKIEKRKHKKV
jgi:hypothetical protein